MAIGRNVNRPQDGGISDPDPFLTPRRLFLLLRQALNKLISSHYALTNIFCREITRCVAIGEKRDQFSHFIRRKTFTSRYTAQFQGKVVAVATAKGIVTFKIVEQPGNETTGGSRDRATDIPGIASAADSNIFRFSDAGTTSGISNATASAL